MKNRQASALLKNATIVFWDFDGVIKESVHIKTLAFMQLFETYGMAVVEKIRIHHESNGGMSRFKKLPLYLEWSGIQPTDALVKKLSENFSELALQKVIDAEWVPKVEEYIRVNPNIQDFVMVSATPQAELDWIVDKLNLRKYFKGIFGSPTSKGEAIKSVLSSTAINPLSALMIGDASADMEAALINNVPFLYRKHQSNTAFTNVYVGCSINDFREI